MVCKFYFMRHGRPFFISRESECPTIFHDIKERRGQGEAVIVKGQGNGDYLKELFISEINWLVRILYRAEKC
jgi:hypothetical protein